MMIMSLNPKREITDGEILEMKKVPTKIAADYLGMTYSMLVWKLQQGELPFGTAVKNREWTYHIDAQALVEYKNGGSDTDLLRTIHNQLSDIQKQLPEICSLLKAYETMKGAV